MAERLTKQVFFARTLEMSGKCGELLFWEGVKGPKSCSSEERASSCCLPLHPRLVQKDTSGHASSKAGSLPSALIGRWEN